MQGVFLAAKEPGDTGQFSGKKALITGGLGFVGSNLAIRLVSSGADVHIVDCLMPGHGGNMFNIRGIEKDVEVDYSDITDTGAMNRLVKGKDFIFHLAGQNDHVLALNDPFPDLQNNVFGTAVLLEACKKNNRDAPIIYASTRGVYGPVEKLPVSESAVPKPRGLYELTNYMAEKMFGIYRNTHSIQFVNLRLTNLFGPRSQMMHARFGVVNWFIRLALEGKEIPLFGGGGVLRDFLYVDDAVDAFLAAASSPRAFGQTFNVASGRPVSVKEIAGKIVRLAGGGTLRQSPYTPERKQIEPGDFYANISKIGSEIGWRPATGIEEGLKKTIEYYREFSEYYWGGKHAGSGSGKKGKTD